MFGTLGLLRKENRMPSDKGIRAGRAFVELFTDGQPVAGRMDIYEGWYALPLEEE